MPQHEYIFRLPADRPPLTYTELSAYLREHGHVTAGHLYARIGNTVQVRQGARRNAVIFTLYHTVIAHIGPELVYFPETGDAHIATTYWLGQICADNGIGGSPWRSRRRVADGPGTPVARGRAGVLLLNGDWNRPVEGYAYRAGHHDPEPWCNHDPAGVNRITMICECGAPAPARTRYAMNKLAAARA